jgi:Fe2+ transport system protein FeoA
MLNLPFFKNPRSTSHPAQTSTLAHSLPGQTVRISGYGQLPPDYRQHLQAYGLLPGRSVRILSQNPVTIVQIEYTELAFEQHIAMQVLVD